METKTLEEKCLKHFKLEYSTELGTYLDSEGESWDSIPEYILLSELGFCGCGTPEEVFKDLIIPFLEDIRVRKFKEYDDLQYMFLCYWGDDKGILEHGSTIRFPWLTEKGKLILELFKDGN